MKNHLTNDSIILEKTMEWWLGGSDFFGSFEKYSLSREVFNKFIKSRDRVIDLGCANGFLLYSLLQSHSSTFIPFGIDIDAGRITWAKKLLPEFSFNFSYQNTFSCKWYNDHFNVIIAPWDQTYNFPSIVKGYKERHPLTKILFYLYDDDYPAFGEMTNQISKYFSSILEIEEVQIEKLSKIVCVV